MAKTKKVRKVMDAETEKILSGTTYKQRVAASKKAVEKAAPRYQPPLDNELEAKLHSLKVREAREKPRAEGAKGKLFGHNYDLFYQITDKSHPDYGRRWRDSCLVKPLRDEDDYCGGAGRIRALLQAALFRTKGVTKAEKSASDETKWGLLLKEIALSGMVFRVIVKKNEWTPKRGKNKGKPQSEIVTYVQGEASEVDEADEVEDEDEAEADDEEAEKADDEADESDEADEADEEEGDEEEESDESEESDEDESEDDEGEEEESDEDESDESDESEDEDESDEDDESEEDEPPKKKKGKGKKTLPAKKGKKVRR